MKKHRSLVVIECLYNLYIVYKECRRSSGTWEKRGEERGTSRVSLSNLPSVYITRYKRHAPVFYCI